MNVKNFLVSGIVGGIFQFLLGWLFYGILFKNSFPTNGKENMLFIFLGCMTFGFFVSYIFTKWAGISNVATGLKAGAVIGLFMSLYSNFFMNSMTAEINYQTMGLDVVITVIMAALVGAVIALVNGKLK
ncbi:hypothetical protein [Flavobacterium algoritolerans]|uniref:DUF1761 domain-containing protein n=1 Tax=Flavobacterium algoritolerans TaxID=3041254 RepID=A0ABT6V8N7_9FLAO|nr:hypothetical protein [Flavobacterium algoritolerans]MDI5894599.1 hypothetical protein [Flavobacterium algoritolerans]